MTNQHEITKRMPLLNREGNLTEPGWARGLLWDYHRPDIRASGMRIKEWDYYFVSNGHIGLALTIADNGYMGLDSVSYLDFDEKWEITKSPMRLLPMGKTALPETSAFLLQPEDQLYAGLRLDRAGRGARGAGSQDVVCCAGLGARRLDVPQHVVLGQRVR